MKIISWNVAGVNACIRKGLLEIAKNENADVYCFQEMKATPEKMPKFLGGYYSFHSHAKKKGYSGVSVFSKIEPFSVIYGIGDDNFDSEGRVLTLEFKDFFLINAYFPHAHRELTRLDYKLKFNAAFLRFCKDMEKMKPIIIASDFNVAHTELDLANPKSNMKNAGFTQQERNWFTSFLQEGFIDTFREFTKEGKHYTWWTYRSNARERNIGWRIDYFVISESLRNRLHTSNILKDILGSDHCPIKLEINPAP
jgi:exodeoxyribonuclease III